MATMAIPQIHCDFDEHIEAHNLVLLTCAQTHKDIEDHGLKTGDRVFLYDEDRNHGAVAELDYYETTRCARLVSTIFSLGEDDG